MTCRNCGQEVHEGSVFCPHCGAAQAPSPESPWNTPSGSAPAWEGPEGGGRKKKTGLFIGIGAAVAAVIVLAAVLAGGLFSNPKKQVEAAFVKSAAAYAQAEKALNLPDINQWQRDQEITQRLELELKSINSSLVGYDMSALSGLALGFDTSYSGADRLMSLELAARWGEEELLGFWIKAEDDALYFNSPQLTGDVHYGVNTETLGADLAAMTGDDSVKDLSFNLFDLVDMVLERVDQEKLEQDLKAANKALWEEAKVKKSGTRTLDLNGTETKTAAYRVTFPQKALEDYADALVEVMSAMSYYDLYEDIYRSMGMPQDQIDEIIDALEELDPYDALADDLKDAIDETGDLELEVCLSGGHVSALLYEGEIDSTDLSLALYLGGGEAYVDDLSLELEVDGEAITVKSTGDHGGKSGVFTDKTTIKGDPLRAASLTSITSELRYEPKKSSGNFSWKLAIPGAGSLDMSGTLAMETDYVLLNLDSVTLKVVGMEVCSLAFEYYVDCHPGAAIVEDPKLITQMDQMELLTAALDIQSRAEAWAVEMEELFTSRLPDELLYGQMGGVLY